MKLIMNRRRFLEFAAAAATSMALPAHSTILASPSGQAPSDVRERGLLLYIDPRLASEADVYRKALHTSLASHPLLQALAGSHSILEVSSPTPDQLAYNHVLLIALPDDPLLLQAWQREAAIDTNEKSIYAFGFGHLRGSIGYLEADRNPFLHAAAVQRAPYECEWISVTGTDRAGVSLAFDALLKQSLVNGLIAAPGWKRTEPTLLDRDPLPAGFILPFALPRNLDTLYQIALTQVAEDEYRGVLADTGVMPRSIWQAKYYQPGQWDAGGQIASFHNYATGLHRRAYGNAIWAATFDSAAEAATSAPKIAGAARLKIAGSGSWTGDLPPYAWGTAELGDSPTTGSLTLQTAGETILLTSKTNPLSL